jgi:hypothetical protein
MRYKTESRIIEIIARQIKGFRSFFLEETSISGYFLVSLTNIPPLKKNHIKNIPVISNKTV